MVPPPQRDEVLVASASLPVAGSSTSTTDVSPHSQSPNHAVADTESQLSDALDLAAAELEKDFDFLESYIRSTIWSFNFRGALNFRSNPISGPTFAPSQVETISDCNSGRHALSDHPCNNEYLAHERWLVSMKVELDRDTLFIVLKKADGELSVIKND